MRIDLNEIIQWIIDESFNWKFYLIVSDLAWVELLGAEYIVSNHINFPVIYDDQPNMQNSQHSPSQRNWKAPRGALQGGDQVWEEKKKAEASDLKMFMDWAIIWSGSVE